MKVSFTTLAVLLSATAVHALPTGSLEPVPPSTVPGDLKEGIETLAKSGLAAVAGIIQAIPKLIKGTKEAKANKKAWREEQEREEADEADESEPEAVKACWKPEDEFGQPQIMPPGGAGWKDSIDTLPEKYQYLKDIDYPDWEQC